MMGHWHHVELGSGEPIVVLHGGMGLDHSYLRACDSLADSHRLIYLDQIGNGRSADPVSWQDWSYASWAADLESFRHSSSTNRWTVLAHSAGVFVALEYALAYPERVARLVLVGGGASLSHVAAIEANVQRYVDQRVARRVLELLATQPDDDLSFAHGWREVLPIYFSRWEPRYLRAFEHTRYRARALGAARPPDLLARLREITVPTLVLCGDDDFIMPAREAGTLLAQGIPNADLQVIPRCGHFPMIEQPVKFDGVVRRFLEYH